MVPTSRPEEFAGVGVEELTLKCLIFFKETNPRMHQQRKVKQI